MNDLTTFKMGKKIPKIIHQICASQAQLPSKITENIRNICDLNPDWEHRLYDDNDMESFILEYYGFKVLQIYKKINFSYGAARADFFRYLLLYAEGGVYLDLKSSVTQPFDSVIDLDNFFILSKWDQEVYPNWGLHQELDAIGGAEYQQWHIIAVAGHPFLRSVIESVIDNIEQYNILRDGVGKKGVLKVTGPIAYTLAIEAIKPFHSFDETNISKKTGIEYSIFNIGENHKNIFKKHYSNLKSPIIYPNSLYNYYSVGRYYLCNYVPKIIQSLKSVSKILRIKKIWL